MIDFKRLTAVVLAVLMLCSFAVIGVSADDGDEDPHEAGWYVVGDAAFFGTSWGDDIPLAKAKMTMVNGVYTCTYTDAPTGTFSFKVVETTSIGAISTWHPDGMGNDSSFTVTTEGSTVRFCLVPQKSNSNDKPYAEVFAPGEELPDITEPTTAPKPTQPPETVPEGKVKVNVQSNLSETKASATYDTSLDSEVTVDFNLDCANPFTNIQGYLEYNSDILELESFTLADSFKNVVINTELKDKITFNSTYATAEESNSYMFSGEAFAKATFKFVSTGEATLAMTVEEINAVTQGYDIYSIVTDGAVAEGMSVSGSYALKAPTEPESSSETSETSSSETVPPTPAKTTVSAKAAKSVYVGSTTKVTATVKNGKGTTAFTTSNKKVATVSSKGVVKGIKKGTVIIKVINNKVSAKVTIKVVQRTNPMTVKAKTITVKAKAKKTTFKKTKAFTIKKAKGTVSFKKVKGDKKVTITKKGVITVKKGLKKGKSYKLKVKVTAKGTTAYKAKSKTVTVKIKVSK